MEHKSITSWNTKKKNQEVYGNLEYISQTAKFPVNLERKL